MALSDHDPATMMNSNLEELSFSKRDTIKVLLRDHRKGGKQYYWGECKGKIGYVPRDKVVSVGGNRDEWPEIYANAPVKAMVALYDYDPQQYSPNPEIIMEVKLLVCSVL